MAEARPTVATGTDAARNLAGTVAGGLLIASIEFAATRGTVEFTVVEQLAWLARLAVHWTLAALPVGLAIATAEWRAPDGAPSRAAYAVAVLVGATAGAAVMALHGKFIDPAISHTAVGLDLTLVDRFLYGLWQLGFWGIAGAVLHATDLRHRRNARALQRVELARLRSEGTLAEARLAALHAQVEPGFVLATLDTVGQLYARDVAAADRVLDALIQFLREATPQLRRQSTTLGQELRLLQTYVQVLGAATGSAGSVTVDVDARAAQAAVPPGLLVSLAQRILGAPGTGTTRFVVATRRMEHGLELDFSAQADRIDCSPELRDFIAAAGQRLVSSRDPTGAIAILRPGEHGLTLRFTLIEHQGG